MTYPKDTSYMSMGLVPAREKHLIHNMMQFYLYDFTQFLDIDLNDQGMFNPYPDLDQYWTQRDRSYAYVIRYQNKPAGFALVDRMENISEADYYLTEFFIMKKYRRYGLGTWASWQLFDRLQGRWKVTQVSSNLPAQAFWRKVLHAYTNGDYKERVDPERGNPSQYFTSRN